MSCNWLRGSLAVMAAVVVLGALSVASAQDDEAGPIIQIGPSDAADSDESTPRANDETEVQQQAPKYWIGLLGGAISEDHLLRSHVDIPEGQGLLVVNVVPESPAEEAGLKAHDILLRANDRELHDMHELVDLVLTEGEKGNQIALEVLRHGKRETIYITPEERPADVRPQASFGRHGMGPQFGGGQLPQELLENLPFEFRNFGPGVILGDEGPMAGGIPNGVSVSIHKEQGEPTRITVKRGEETWEVQGDDPASLEQLPEDLRPFVEQMLRDDSMRGFGFGPGNMEPLGDERIRERLERMERRMQQLQERLLGPQAEPAENAEPEATENDA